MILLLDIHRNWCPSCGIPKQTDSLPCNQLKLNALWGIFKSQCATVSRRRPKGETCGQNGQILPFWQSDRQIQEQAPEGQMAPDLL